MAKDSWPAGFCPPARSVPPASALPGTIPCIRPGQDRERSGGDLATDTGSSGTTVPPSPAATQCRMASAKPHAATAGGWLPASAGRLSKRRREPQSDVEKSSGIPVRWPGPARPTGHPKGGQRRWQ